MEHHEKDDESECGECHHGDGDVTIFHEIDIFTAGSGDGAIKERGSAHLEV